MGKKLLVAAFILLFATPAAAVLIGDIETANLGPATFIKYLGIENEEGRIIKSAAFSYSIEIRVVIGVVSLIAIPRIYIQQWEYESVRYLKNGTLYYYAWDNELREYVLTKAPIELEKFWTMQLKQLVDGV